MKQTEYEKLCDEAFGKPEKPKLPEVLKKHKKLAICIVSAAVCTAIAVFLLVKPRGNPSYTLEKPVALKVYMVQENTVEGIDLNGKRWIVQGNVENVFVGRLAWFVCDPDAIQDTSAGQVTDFTVENARIWCGRSSDSASMVYDICDFDIDGDGEIEQCILSTGSTSGLQTHTLSVWNGDMLESELVYYSSDRTVAFYSEDASLKIVGVVRHSDNTLREHNYDILYENGELKISENGIIKDTMPKTVPA